MKKGADPTTTLGGGFEVRGLSWANPTWLCCPACLPASSKPFQRGLMRVRSPEVYPGRNVSATPGYVKAILLASLSPREARSNARPNSGWGRGKEGEGKRGRGAGSCPHSPGAITQVKTGQKLSSSPKDPCPTASGALLSGIRPTQTECIPKRTSLLEPPKGKQGKIV